MRPPAAQRRDHGGGALRENGYMRQTSISFQ